MIRRRFLGLAGLALLPAAAFAAEGEKKKGGGASYLQIPTITATIVRADGRRGVLTVETGVDAPDPAVLGLARASLPRLRAAYTQTVQVYAAGLPSSAAPDAEFISRSLQRETDRILGRRGARVLLGTILVN